ncbi:hypothetical protein CTI12_AA379660 [Artemisia annua]|uniref:Uncharacterized protein n=1 Tax=Artemisia annua TaxID=35608 RepID=A0A2U1MHR1_ARTAN|nr:hypothetical protein CTI12_AA379660 [Artemisia annua]
MKRQKVNDDPPVTDTITQEDPYAFVYNGIPGEHRVLAECYKVGVPGHSRRVVRSFLGQLDKYRVTLNASVELDQRERQYNRPTTSEVAGIWVEGNNYISAYERDIVVYGGLNSVKIFNPTSDEEIFREFQEIEAEEQAAFRARDLESESSSEEEGWVSDDSFF